MVSWALKKRNCQPMGILVGDEFIKLIQLAVEGDRVSVIGANNVYLGEAGYGDGASRRSAVINAIRGALESGNFEGKQVYSCLSNREVEVTSLRINPEDSHDVETILRKEASKRFGFDESSSEIKHLEVGHVRNGDEIKNELILFAASYETIKDHIDLLEECGLEPTGIDTVPCCLFRVFERGLRRQEDSQRTVVFIDIDSDYTTVVFGKYGEISFVKQIPIGVSRFNRDLAEKLNISYGEAKNLRRRFKLSRTRADSEVPSGDELDASTRQIIVDQISSVSELLAREISLCFRYYTVTFRGKRVERAIIASGESDEKIMLNVLKRQLPVEIELAEPFRNLDISKVDFKDDRRSDLCDWSAAVGLGLKGLRSGKDWK